MAAATAVRVAVAHYIVRSDDKEQFLDQLRLVVGIKHANQRIYEAAQRSEELHGMGTTIVAARTSFALGQVTFWSSRETSFANPYTLSFRYNTIPQIKAPTNAIRLLVTSASGLKK